ncbi:MAG TPA: LysR family transcriptional regulator [Polyangia bacterium]
MAFARTVEARSLSRAAVELGIPRATLGRRLARLEQRLDARLLRRTTRSLVLTDAGEALYPHARIALDAVSHAEASVRRIDDVVRGELRVSVPPIMSPGFRAMLTGFAVRYPEVRLQVSFSTQLVDLQRGDYDLAVRAGSAALQPGLVARTFARDPVIAVASPRYLAERGVPRTRRDLRAHRCLMGFARGEVPQTYWPLAGGGQVHVTGAFFSNELTLLTDAAVMGLGIAMLPLMLAGPFLERGELTHVLPKTLGAESRIAVVHVEREFVPAPVRAFIDALIAWAPSEFTKGRPPPPFPTG